MNGLKVIYVFYFAPGLKSKHRTQIMIAGTNRELAKVLAEDVCHTVTASLIFL
jgi:hypothetical protein